MDYFENIRTNKQWTLHTSFPSRNKLNKSSEIIKSQSISDLNTDIPSRVMKGMQYDEAKFEGEMTDHLANAPYELSAYIRYCVHTVSKPEL